MTLQREEREMDFNTELDGLFAEVDAIMSKDIYKEDTSKVENAKGIIKHWAPKFDELESDDLDGLDALTNRVYNVLDFELESGNIDMDGYEWALSEFGLE